MGKMPMLRGGAGGLCGSGVTPAQVRGLSGGEAGSWKFKV